jgi:hypothetical protein
MSLLFRLLQLLQAGLMLSLLQQWRQQRYSTAMIVDLFQKVACSMLLSL